MLKRFFDRIPPILKNRYLLTGVAFIVVLTFFDGNNMFYQFKLQKELKGLKAELKHLKEETIRDSTELVRLKTDTLEMERIGRENYQMKRDSEDVFIIVRKPKAKKN